MAQKLLSYNSMKRLLTPVVFLLLLIGLTGTTVAQAARWHIETLASVGDVGSFSSIATDANGDLHLGCVDRTGQILLFGTRDDWSDWRSFVVSGASDSFAHTELLVNPAGTDRYLFYFFGPDNLKYKKIGPNGDFTTHDVSLDSKGYFSAALRDGQFPHVLRRDKRLDGQGNPVACSGSAVDGDDCLLHRWMKSDGSWSGWERLRPYRIRGRNALAVGSDGRLHAAFVLRRSDSGPQSGLLMRYDRYSLNTDGASYNMVSDSGTGAAFFYTNQAADEGLVSDAYLSMTLDASNNPLLCYYDPIAAALFYRGKENGSTWSPPYLIESRLSLPAGTEVGRLCEIAYSAADNRVHIAYYHPALKVLKYTRKTVDSTSSWEGPVTVDPWESSNRDDLGSGLSLAVDGQGFAHISYYDATNQDLKYATNKPLCGDGVVSSTEACDDGNTIAGDGCSATCQTEPSCGNGACETGESNASCSTDCPLSAVCPNGVCDVGEDSTSCSADCSSSCGNGTCDTAENDVTCPADCQPQCGNSTCEMGENNSNCSQDCGATCGNAACERTETNSTCPADCAAVCGNQVCEGGENNQNCSQDCGVSCGDSLCGAGETNTTCLRDCPAVCGNGVQEGTEQCDDRNTTAGDGCSATCQSEGGPMGSVCGNTTLETGEQCDDGNMNSGDGCDTTCQSEGSAGPACGNRIVETGEECDDGNVTAGDGCNEICKTEGTITAQPAEIPAPTGRPVRSGGCTLVK